MVCIILIMFHTIWRHQTLAPGRHVDHPKFNLFSEGIATGEIDWFWGDAWGGNIRVLLPEYDQRTFTYYTDASGLVNINFETLSQLQVVLYPHNLWCRTPPHTSFMHEHLGQYGFSWGRPGPASYPDISGPLDIGGGAVEFLRCHFFLFHKGDGKLYFFTSG